MQHNMYDLAQSCRSSVKETDITQVKNKLDNNETFILVDVREDSEWNSGHIPSAIHIARSCIEQNISRIIPNKNSEVILYCGVGVRSILAAHTIQNMGYTNVTSMDGGISGWTNAGYKLVM